MKVVSKFFLSLIKIVVSNAIAYDWNDFHSHKDINKFIDDLACSNSDWVQTVSIGKTFEGRDMRVIEINKAGPNAPIAWIDASIHGNEWITSATVTYLINELVVNYGEIREIVDNLNIHILPMANPDGYEYSRSGHGLGRKNRNTTNCACYESFGYDNCGVDLNRNWGYKWGWGFSTSDDPCNPDIYRGVEPFSEAETLNIKNYLERLPATPVLGLSVHCAGNAWLWPYGYAADMYPYNIVEIKKLAKDAAGAMKQVNGNNFETMKAWTSGASKDWYRGVLGTRYSYTVELGDNTKQNIKPSGKEFLAGMKVVFNKLIQDSLVEMSLP